jgi:hypothetical protein
MQQQIARPVVAVDDRCGIFGGNVRRKPIDEALHRVDAFGFRRPVLRRPPMHLTRDVIARFSVVREAGRTPIDLVKAREHFDHRPKDRAALLSRMVRQRCVDDRMAVDVLHDEERRADDAEVLAEQMRFGNGNTAFLQRRHDLILALDRVRRRKQVAGWFSAKHQRCGRSFDVIGRI